MTISRVLTPLFVCLFVVRLLVVVCIISGNADLERKLVSSLLQLIERERQGENVNRHVLKNLLRMLIALRVYRQSFEAPFMKATESFYETEAQRLINELNVPDYLAHVSKRLNEEVGISPLRIA